MTTTKEQQAAEALALVERLSRMTDPYDPEACLDNELEAWRSTIREACDIMGVEFTELDDYDGDDDSDAWSGGFAENH